MNQKVRQLIRWQCRLSHVAAHTRMLTVFLEDMHTRPVIEIEKMISFIGLKVSQKNIETVLNEFLPALDSGIIYAFTYNS